MNDLKLLMFISDDFPTHRPDVTVLFGKYLPRNGGQIDLVARGGTPGEQYDWPG